MATLQYDFKVVGLNSVMAAFRSLEQRALQHNRMLARMYGNTGTGGRAGGTGGVGGVGGTGGGTRGVQADAHVRERRRMLRQQAIDDRRAFQESAKSHKEFLAFRDRMFREEDRKQDAHNRRQQTLARRAANAVLQERRRIATSMYQGGVGALTNLGSRAASMLTLGGGAALAAGISSELRLGKATTLLAVLSKQANEKGSIKDIQKGLTERVRAVGKESGLDRGELVSSMSSFFAASGRVDVAKELLPFFAKMADVTGASLEDVGTTAGQAYMQAIADGMSKEQAVVATKDIISAFAGQAAVGSIELKDFIRQGPKLLSTAQRFNMPLAEAAGLMAAFAETSPLGGAPGAAEAGTSVQRFADELSTSAQRFEDKGVKVFEKTASGASRMRNPFAIVKDVLRKTGAGDEQVFNEYFKNVRSVRAVKGLFTIYSKAGGGDRGMAAVDAEIARFMGAKLTPAQIEEGAAAVRETPARQFEAAFNDLKDAVGQSLLPALTNLAPKFAELVVAITPLIDMFGRLAKFTAENPKKAAAYGVTAYLGGSVLTAGAGALVTAAVKSVLGGGATAATGAVAGTAAAEAAGTTGVAATGATALGAGPIAALIAGTGATLFGAYKGAQRVDEMLTPEMQEAHPIASFFAKGIGANLGSTTLGVALAAAQAGGEIGSDIGKILFGEPVKLENRFQGATGGAQGSAQAGGVGAITDTVSGAFRPAAQALMAAAEALKGAASTGLNRSDAPSVPSPTSGGAR